MKKIIIGVAVSLIVILSGVFYSLDSLSKQVNELWPPLTTYAVRYTSTQKNLSIVNDEQFVPDVLVSLTRNEILKQSKPYIEDIKKKASKINVDGLSELKLNDVKLLPIEQGVMVKVDTQFTIDEIGLTVNAVAIGDVAFEASINAFTMRPVLSQININPINSVKDKWIVLRYVRNNLVESISGMLSSLIDNLNGIFLKDGFTIPVDLSITKQFSLSDIKNKDNISIAGSDVEMNYALPSFAFFITNQSINLMASTQKGDQSGKQIITPKDISSQQFMSEYKKLQDAVTQKLDKTYGKEFTLKQPKTTAVVRKAMLANVINRTMSDLDINISAKEVIVVPDPNKPADDNKFFEEIKLHKDQKLPDCSGLRRQFKGEACDNPCSYSHINCEQNYNNLPSCDYGCSWRRPDRCAREAACKVARESRRAALDARRAACITDRETRRVNCQRKNAECITKREADRIAHQAENETRVAKCNTKRAALKLVDGLVKLGEIHGDYWVKNSSLSSNIKRLNVIEDLSQATIAASLDVSLDASVRLNVNPEGLGHIACVFGFRKTLDTHANYHNDNLLIKGVISHRKDPEGNLQIVVTTEEQKIKHIKLDPSPYEQLIADPGFVLNCTFLTMAIPTVAGAQLLSQKVFNKGKVNDSLKTMFGRGSFTMKSKEYPFTIKPIKIGKKDDNLALKPKWGNKLIRFDLK
jgi:hypothetical protein